jgi:hypothetical protein
MADATRQRTHHVFATRWVDWFYNADYFDEFVLWMDCCMVFDLFVAPETAGFRILQGAGTGRMFAAYAAKFPHQAVERTMPDGTHEVTSASLKDYLTQNMKAFMPTVDIEDSTVSKEPDFGFDDPLVFCTFDSDSLPRTTVKFTFPASIQGQKFTVVTGAPPEQVANGDITSSTGEVKLPPGIYFVKVASVSRGFEVDGSAEVQVNV